MKQMLLDVLDLVKAKAWWGEPIDRYHLERIAKVIDQYIPPPGTEERRRYCLELANYLAGAVAGFPPDVDTADRLPD